MIIAYIPVLHQGYYHFFHKCTQAGASTLVLLDAKWLQAVPGLEYLRKDSRALDPKQVAAAVQAWGVFTQIVVANDKDTIIELLNQIPPQTTIYLPNDDISRHLLAQLPTLAKRKPIIDSVFLRWDRKNALTAKLPSQVQLITASKALQALMGEAVKESEKSADWWRQVGAVVAKDGRVLLSAYNRHLPHEQQPYFDGDVRALFHQGDHIELTTAIHAEAALIAQAAKQGISLHNADLFVTTFPCPVCAKSIAAAGIKRLYYIESYAMLDGETVLTQAGVELYKLEM